MDSIIQPKKPDVPCRTCTDFKTWAKQQREVMHGRRNKSTDENGNQAATTNGKSITSFTSPAATSIAQSMASKHGCPYDKDDLGRSTWGLLHTMAAHYPDEPSVKQEADVTKFITLLSKYYPCEFCARDFRQELRAEPIQAKSQETFSQWLCRMHNKVNIKIGKPVFDCSMVNQRWRDGWKDGSCDEEL